MPYETLETLEQQAEKSEKQAAKELRIPNPGYNCKDKNWFCTNIASCIRAGEYFEALQNPEYASQLVS